MEIMVDTDKKTLTIIDKTSVKELINFINKNDFKHYVVIPYEVSPVEYNPGDFVDYKITTSNYELSYSDELMKLLEKDILDRYSNESYWNESIIKDYYREQH